VTSVAVPSIGPLAIDNRVVCAPVELADEEGVVNDDVGRRVGRKAHVVVVLAERERLRIDRIDERRGPGPRAEPLPPAASGRVERARQNERRKAPSAA